STGTSTDQGGLALFKVDLSPQAPPIRQRTEYQGIEHIKLVTAGGDDNILVNSAPPSNVATTEIESGAGQDHIVVNDYVATTTVDAGANDDTIDVRVVNAKTASDSLTVKGGDGNDTVDLQSTGQFATTTLQGEAGNDTIIIESVGEGAVTEVFGGDGN